MPLQLEIVTPEKLAYPKRGYQRRVVREDPHLSL